MVQENNVLSARKVQFLSLFIVGIMELLLITCGTGLHYLGYFVTEHYLAVPVVLFFGATLTTELTPSGKRMLLAGGAMVIWLAIAQSIHRTLGEEPDNISMWWAAYLLALPFAAAVRDGSEQKGLRIMSGVFVAAPLVLAGYAALLVTGLLGSFQLEGIGWDGARLVSMWHSNITACLLMIGIALCLGFFFETGTTWKRWLLMAAAVIQFAAMALTNCRTSILMTCALTGGVVFFLINRGGWKRFLAGVLAAAMAAVLLFAASDRIYKANSQRLLEQYQAELMAGQEDAGEAYDLPAEVPSLNEQGDLAGDLKTLNNRTYIWASAFRALRDRKEVVNRGTSYVGMIVSAGGLGYTVDHAHNSWLEILIGFGMPALLLALCFTAMTVWNAGFLLLSCRSSMWQKCIALLALCLLMAGFLEPMLFTGYIFYQFINLFFFLCLGYMDEWRRALRADR